MTAARPRPSTAVTSPSHQDARDHKECAVTHSDTSSTHSSAHMITPHRSARSNISQTSHSASGGPRSGMVPGFKRLWWVTMTWVSRRIGAKGATDQGQVSRSFSRRVLHLDTCPWFVPRQARRCYGGYHFRIPHGVLLAAVNNGQ